DVVAVEHEAARLLELGKGAAEAVGGDLALDGTDRLVGIVDGDRREGARGEVALEVGAAPVEGKGEAEEAVGQLLGPVIGELAALQHDVIAEGEERLGLVGDVADAAAEDRNLAAEMRLKAPGEVAAMAVARRHRLVRGDDGEERRLLRHAGTG